MWSRLLVIAIYIKFQAYVFGRECGSYEAVKHISYRVSERIRDVSSPLIENGGTASLHSSATNFGSNTHKCGAVLISDRYLLTAAHCMDSKHGLISIRLGTEDLNEYPNSGRDTYRIEKVIRHPDWRSATHAYSDLAILQTDKPVIYKDKIWPFCLPTQNQAFDDYFAVQISGWGQVNQSLLSSSLIQVASIVLIENSRCESLWRQEAPDNYDIIRQYDYPQGLSRKVMCAGKPGTDACGGDSGGPMTYQNNKGLHTVIGIIAKGINCPGYPVTPGFYTNIGYYVNWINQVLSNTPQTTPVPPLAVFPGQISPDVDSGDGDQTWCRFIDIQVDCKSVSTQCPQKCSKNDPSWCRHISPSDCSTAVTQCPQKCSLTEDPELCRYVPLDECSTAGKLCPIKCPHG